MTGVNFDRDRLKDLANDASSAFARGHTEEGTSILADFAAELYSQADNRSAAMILSECAKQLKEFGPERDEYVLLAFHAAKAAMNSSYSDTPR